LLFAESENILQSSNKHEPTSHQMFKTRNLSVDEISERYRLN